LFINVEKSFNLFIRHAGMVGAVGVSLFAASLVAFGYRYRKDIRRGGMLLVFLLMVALAPYAQAVPVGIDVVPRTRLIFCGKLNAFGVKSEPAEKSMRDRN